MLSRSLNRINKVSPSLLKRSFKVSPRCLDHSGPKMRYVEELPGRKKITTGEYLARRLEQVGVVPYFTIPGDFTLSLLDELLKSPTLRMVGCCNELNAGYAADGYSRATGKLSVAIVTYCVGGLSIVNAAAGAYSDDLPMLLISGGPNTNDSQQRHLIHHTIGERDFYQSGKVFEPVVHKTFVIRHQSDITQMIDQAIYSAITEKKPVYLEIPCNLARFAVPEPTPLNFSATKTSDPDSLKAAIDDILAHINASVKPVLVGGVKLRKANASYEFEQLANKLQSAVALMPDAKSLFSEDHPLYIGRYWPSVSSPGVSEVVESCDLFLFAGPIFNDYTTTGWTALIPASKLIEIQPEYVNVRGTRYNNVIMSELLSALAESVPSKDLSFQTYQRLVADIAHVPPSPPDDEDSRLTLHEIRRQIQNALTPETELVIETGDSWFIGQGFKIPDGLKYHVQMQYGSIGWSVGAVLGAALGAQESGRKVLALIGDGSFQLTCQELSTIIRQDVKATIILLNNDGYTIEVEIHDGPYNDIQGWDYSKLVEVFNGRDGRGLGIKARTSRELTEALATADNHDGLTFIECYLSRDDCTKELLLWGSHVASSNGRPPAFS